MYVKMGKYPSWVGPYQLAEKILFWMDKDEDDRVHEFGRWLAGDGKKNGSWLMRTCSWFHNTFQNGGERRIKVRIDRYDTWGMDHTLAPIILPMLKQLRDNKHGSPYVDDADLPEHLRMTKREKKVFEEGYWNKKLRASEDEQAAASAKFHARWDWVMEQMIWSFEQLMEPDEGRSQYYDPYLPDEPTEKKGYKVVDEDDNETRDFLFDEETTRRMGKFNHEKMKVYAKRQQLGFTLFGKYFTALLD